MTLALRVIEVIHDADRTVRDSLVQFGTRAGEGTTGTP
jgi:hypothetical protein